MNLVEALYGAGSSLTKLREVTTLKALDQDATLIINRRGKRSYVLVDLDCYEDLLAASSPEYLVDIAQARQRAKQGDTLSLNEVLENL